MMAPVAQRAALVLSFMGLAALARAGDPVVSYQNGLLAIHCADAPVSGVLERIKAVTGMALILEGVAAGTRLTAEVEAQPPSIALQRLLEGTGVDYALVVERADPRRVATLYVGDRKGGTAAPASAQLPATSPRPSPVAATEPAPVPDAPPEDDETADPEIDFISELEEAGTGAGGGAAPADPRTRAERRTRLRRPGAANRQAPK